MHPREHFNSLEIARRKSGGSVRHPDLCPKLRLHGVDFAVPPRGLRVTPVFARGQVTVAVTGSGEWPQVARLLAAVTVRQTARCAKCGQTLRAVAEADARQDAGFLAVCFDLAGSLLRCQYDLTDDELTELLAFSLEAPPIWLAQLLRWCLGHGE
jgi:hypothetical protein